MGLNFDNIKCSIILNSYNASHIQDCINYKIVLGKGDENGIYQIGTINGFKVFLDPNLSWNDTKIYDKNMNDITNIIKRKDKLKTILK